MAIAVRVLATILTSKKGRGMIKNFLVFCLIFLSLPLMLFSGVKAIEQQQEERVIRAIENVKENEQIDNIIAPLLIIAIENEIHENVENVTTAQYETRIKDDYIKDVVILDIEDDHNHNHENEENDTTENNVSDPQIVKTKTITMFKTKSEIMAYITTKYKPTDKQIEALNIFIKLSNLTTVTTYNSEWLLPTESGQVTCSWNCYPNHTGTDIGAPTGTNILASATGTIIYSSGNICIEGNRECGGGFGNHIVIAHNVSGVEYITIYAHLITLEIDEKSINRNIIAGTVLGQMGNTGRSDGTHLHYEIIKDVQHFPSKSERLTLGIDTETIIDYPEKW